MSRKSKLLVGAALMALVAAGCGSSAKSAGSNGTGGSSKAITVGILTDLTGPGASGNKTTPIGAQAGAIVAAQDGYTIKFVEADTETNPSAVLPAAQKLVEQDHVTAVIAVSALTFAAANYLKSQGIPVVGTAEDGPEWGTNANMFSVFGFVDESKASTTYGAFFKLEGVTNVGSLGYGISPQSALAAKAAAISAQTAGLQVGYLNANFPFGSTNVTPVALAMKSNGVDGFTSSTDPNTSFALVTALRNAGDNVKVALLPTGYGGDLLQAGPGALHAAQGLYFYLTFEPAEMHTAATEQFQSALKSVGVTSDPTYAEYDGYASVGLLVDALKVTGPQPSHAALIAALSGVQNFDAWGLLGSHTFSMSARTSTQIGVDGCIYVTKLVSSAFQLVPGADPICGTEIPSK